MRLDALVAGVAEAQVHPAGDGRDGATTEVTAVVHDTRAVTTGALFCCVPGERVDGHDLAPQAVAAGAVALLVERPVDVAVPQVLVPSVRQAMGPVAAELWGHPSQRVPVVGVTQRVQLEWPDGKTAPVELADGGDWRLVRPR